jgi:protein-disulfide isomerase
MKKWSACAETKESPDYKAAEKAVDESVAFGTAHGVSGTPGFFVNGMFINGAQPVESFDAAIAAVKNAGAAPAAAPAPAPASAPADKKS